MEQWTFSSDGRKFFVRTPYTPRPWINYLTNSRYFALVSQTGGGFSFYLDPSHHVVTRREQDLLLNDRPGRFVFLQDVQTGEVWNVGGNPCRSPLDEFECCHTFGLTRLWSKRRGVEASVEFFVPLEDDCEVWKLTVSNHDEKPRTLRVLAYQEWLLGNSIVDPVARRFDCFFKRVSLQEGVVVGEKLVWGLRGERANRPWEFVVFCCSTRQPDAVWLEKEDFVGLYRELGTARALDTPTTRPSHSTEVWGVDSVCVPEWTFSLEPGRSTEWYVVTGIAPKTDWKKVVPKLQDSQRLEQLQAEVLEHWKERTSRLIVRCPDESVNILHSSWTPYQVLIKSYLSSAPSYYHASDGTPGVRDALQDAFGLCLLEPERARAMVLRLARFQFSDGSASHRAPRIPLSLEPSEKSDLPAWLSLPTLQYVRETGDLSILDEIIPFADSGEGSLLEHIRRGLERSLKDVGPHGLPLIRRGDWNDALDGVGGEGRGESVFLAQFVAFSLKNSALLAKLAGRHELAELWLEQRERLCRILNEHCWDEDRFVRAFHDDGSVVGCRANKEGRLYLNPQVWAVLAETSSKERLLCCMDSVHRELDTPFGIRCLAPPYSSYDPQVGLISCFPPGVKENGAVFSHAMAFCLVAELMLGRAERAWELLQKASPILRARRSREYGVEPYVYSQFMAGPETNLAGQGFHHWLTGTSSWMQYAVVNWLLGVRAEVDGLRIDPCIPSQWKGFELVRQFRGCRVTVKVENPHGRNHGVSHVLVDGQPVEGNLIPPPKSQQMHVLAVLE